MKTKTIASIGVFAAALILAGCDSTDSPAAYQIPVSYTMVNTSGGEQNAGVTGVKDVDVRATYPFFFQVNSPILVNCAVYEKDAYSGGGGGGSRGALLSQMQGTSFGTMITPNSDAVEFVLSPAVANTAGTVQLTVSERPMAPIMATVPPAPVTTTTTTVTTPSEPTR